MPAYWPVALIGLIALVLLVWSIAAKRRHHRAQRTVLDRLGFRPCPEEKDRLEEIVTGIEFNTHYDYCLRDPMRLSTAPSVYFYVSVCAGGSSGEPVTAGEELLVRVKHPPAGPVVLFVKPSSLAPGPATRLIAAVATGATGTHPADVERLELPPDLKNTNLLGALGPPGARLYELVDSRTISVVQGLGDAGALWAKFRNGWCSIGGGEHQAPFRLDELLARIRPLL